MRSSLQFHRARAKPVTAKVDPPPAPQQHPTQSSSSHPNVPLATPVPSTRSPLPRRSSDTSGSGRHGDVLTSSRKTDKRSSFKLIDSSTSRHRSPPRFKYHHARSSSRRRPASCRYQYSSSFPVHQPPSPQPLRLPSRSRQQRRQASRQCVHLNAAPPIEKHITEFSQPTSHRRDLIPAPIMVS